MIKKVLVAADLSCGHAAPVLTAAEIAKQHSAELYILHFFPSSFSGKYLDFVKYFKTGEEVVSNVKYEKAVKHGLVDIYDGALKPYENYEIRVTHGIPWQEILRLARKEMVDLIVLGPYVWRSEEEYMEHLSGKISSTIEAVIMREQCPVMIVNRLIPPDHLNFKKIMVSVDFSKSSEYALQFSIRLAKEHNAKLFIFHMVPIPLSFTYFQEELEEKMTTFRKNLEEFSKVIPRGLEYESCVWEGLIPFLEILKYAREKEVELIVMGSHTGEKGKKMSLGGAVGQVSSRSICPVTVVSNPRALP